MLKAVNKFQIFLGRLSLPGLLTAHSMRKLLGTYEDDIGNPYLSLLAYLITIPEEEKPAAYLLWFNIIGIFIALIITAFFNTAALVGLVFGTWLFYLVRLILHYRAQDRSLV